LTIRNNTIFLFLLILAKLSVGQLSEPPDKNVFFIQPQIRIGKILNNMPEMPDRTLSVFGDINIAWQTRGKQIWNQYYKYPQVGLLVSAGYLGNNDILGHSISVVPNLSIRLSNWKKVNIYILLGAGLSYFTKIYDEIDNKENGLIGTKITNKSLVAFDLNYHLSKHFVLTAGVSASHYSDGHFQLPNFGMNIPAINIGVKYFPTTFPREYYKYDSLITYNKNLLFNLKFGIGYHEFGTTIKPTGGPKYPIYSATAYLSKRLNTILNFQFGINYNYYTSYYDFIISQEYYTSHKHFRASSIIAFMGVEFFIGKFGFSGQLGSYLYNKFYKDLQDLRSMGRSWRYQSARYITTRLGVQYYVFKPITSTKLNPWIGAFLKSNGGAADFAEICIGCAF
jgi:hypothetical protein